MNPKRLQAILLSLIIGAGVIAVSAQGIERAENKPSIILSDLDNHWAQDEIQQAVREGWVNGYPDGTFHPDGSVTRAEFTKMLLAAIRLTPGSNTVYWMQLNALFSTADEAVNSREPAVMFADMDDSWLTKQGWTETAVYSGILIPDDYAQQLFQPGKEITRGEIAVLTARSLGLVYPATQDTETQSNFSDRASFSSHQASYIREIADTGIITGYPDGSFRPENTATRAEAVTMVARVIAEMEKGDLSFMPDEQRITIQLQRESDPVEYRGDSLLIGDIVFTSLSDLVTAIRFLEYPDKSMWLHWSMAWKPETQTCSFPYGGGIYAEVTAVPGRNFYGGSLSIENSVTPVPARLIWGEVMVPIFDLKTETSYGLWPSHWDKANRVLSIETFWAPETGMS